MTCPKLNLTQLSEVGRTGNRRLPVKPLVYRYLDDRDAGSLKGKAILDYGCGRYPNDNLSNKVLKFANVWRYDLFHYDERPIQKFDIVAVSNVLNVLPTVRAVKETLKDISGFLKYDGIAVINYPPNPRRVKRPNGKILDENGFESLLDSEFAFVATCPYYCRNKAPLFVVSNIDINGI